MSLLLGQLIYTSFSGVGFQLLASKPISKELQQVFLETIVYQYWNAYNPPPPSYQAAYLKQLNSTNSLFGWLYNEISDDFNRANVPYFICYYLTQPLNNRRLDQVFTCLQRGPAVKFTQQQPPNILAPIYISNVEHYQPAQIGVKIPAKIRHDSYLALEQKQLLELIIPAESQDLLERDNQEYKVNLSLLFESKPTNSAEFILQELVAQKLGILEAVLVSSQGKLLTKPINLERNNVSSLIDLMLHLAHKTVEEFQGQEMEKIFLQTKGGYLVLLSCCPNIFLLVKAERILNSVLEGQINRTVAKLQEKLNVSKQLELTGV